MQILVAQEAILSNAEVYALVKEHEQFRKDTTAQIKEKQRQQKFRAKFHKQLFARNWISVENNVKKYIRQYTTSSAALAVAQQPSGNDNVATFLKLLEDFNLTPVEKMQLVNLTPTTLVEIHLVCVIRLRCLLDQHN